jgi:formylglycine-generating enzyme required for sulfatase activity
VDPAHFVRTLDRLAYDVHESTQRGEIGIRTSLLERRLEMLHPERDPQWSRRLGTFIRKRAGLLEEQRPDPIDPVLTFAHVTLQEYLTARYLTESEDVSYKAARLARKGKHWWEVVKLAAEQLLYVQRKVGHALDLVDWLCPEREPTNEAGWQVVRLAGEVLLGLRPGLTPRDESARSQVEVHHERVCWRLVALLRAGVLDPRERAEAGDVLAQLGDPRFRGNVWHLLDDPLLGFVEIPAGPFLMGTREEDIPMLRKRFGGERELYEWETPQHEVTLPTYYIARYPVTVAQFQAFVEAGGYRERRYWVEAEQAGVWKDGEVKGICDDETREGPADFGKLWNLPNHPVMGVNWYEAMAYCRWLTEALRRWEGRPEPLATLLRKKGWSVTLPSEAEWEKAARGTDGRDFPWGRELDRNRTNCADTDIGTTSAVGCFPGGTSPYEVEDVSGNVREWTRSLYREYPHEPEDGREDLQADGIRVLRGGAFRTAAGRTRCTTRAMGSPDVERFGGFRVVLSPPHLLGQITQRCKETRTSKA